jgi:para-nitrobenzyl esterase
MVMPRAQGLFHRAIAESGAGESVISPESARLIGTRLAAILGVEPSREGIASVPLENLLAAATRLGAEVAAKPRRKLWGDVAHNLMPLEPVVDGDIVPGIPRDLIAAGAARDVGVLIGTNSDEARLFFVPTGAMQKMSPIVAYVFASIYTGHPLRTVRRIRRENPGATPGERAAAVLTEGFYRRPALAIAEGHPGSYVYEFAWRSGAFGGLLGACHALELPFVFDTLGDPAVHEMLGRDAPQSTSDAMHAAWVAFARTGDPGWPAYEPGNRASMRFDTVCELTTRSSSGSRAAP